MKQKCDVYLRTGEVITGCQVRKHPALWMFVEVKTDDGVRVIHADAITEIRPAEAVPDRPPVIII